MSDVQTAPIDPPSRTMPDPSAEPLTPAAPAAVSLREALPFWLRLGFISFGGPAGQIAIMHQELVERRRWLSERRFLHALNYCMVLPGPEAQQLATYLGWLMHRTLGGVLAGVLFVLPSLVLLIGLAWAYLVYGEQPLVAGVFRGIKPAVTALVLHAAWRIGSRTLHDPGLKLLAVVAFLAVFALDAPFPLVVLGAGLAGWIGGRLAPSRFQPGGHAGSVAHHGPALIDDDTPPPSHVRFNPRRLAVLLLVGGVLWALPMGLLLAAFGPEGTFTQMGWFFTKAALLTFGGAYAVLPYVFQGAVEHYGWVSATQMIDGLALGESTPGPLIMVVAFVAFIGGYAQQVFGPEQAFLAGAAAAVLVTWFTFLPSFLFILAGGPLVESTHGELRFTAPLTAISAALVGVILDLALFFGYHVFWPSGFDGHFDWASAVLAGLAALALLRWRRGVIEVLACAGGLGLLLQWAGI